MSLVEAPLRDPASPPTDLRTAIEAVDDVQARSGARAALRAALEHARRLDRPELWSRAVRLRSEAVEEAVASTSPRSIWPPELPDPFPELRGVPEIAADDLTWQVLGGALLHHGSLLVRGLLASEEAARLREGIDAALAGYDAFHAEAPGAASAAYTPFPVPAGMVLGMLRPWSRQSGGVWAAESPRLLEAILEVYRERGVVQAIADYLGESPLVSVGKGVLRRAEPESTPGFHQDGAFMGEDLRTVNVWTALSECGEDAPGLEIVGRRLDHLVERNTEGAPYDWAVGRSVAERAAGLAGIATPRFAAGDALFFDQMMLHSTSVRPEMTRRRYALETWFFAPSAHPAGQLPLVAD